VHLIHRCGPDSAATPEHERRWERWPIPSQGAALVLGHDDTVELRTGCDASAVAHLVPFVENDAPNAALVVPVGACKLFVDGAVPLGLTVLGERAELVLARTRLYFTAREPLTVTSHVGEPEECALCGDPLEGSQVIQCTGCGATSHEGALPDGSERLCFSHHGRCPRCRLTREDFAWTPPEDA